MRKTTSPDSTHPLARFLAVLGAAACLAITAAVWRSVGANQPMWPLPALYFIELMLLGIAVAALFLGESPSGAVLAWGAAGVFAAFSVLGAWTVGFLYLPTTVLLFAASILEDLGAKANLPAHAAVCLTAGVVQAALMVGIALAP